MRLFHTLLFSLAMAGVSAAGIAQAAAPAQADATDPQSLCFSDAEGRPACLPQWHGRVVLLYVWATWCAPCRPSMARLDKVQALLGGKDFQVVALSVDKRGAPAVANFQARNGIRHLAIFTDADAKAMEALSARAIPLSILVDRQGRVAQRVAGPADWDSPERLASIFTLINRPSGPPSGDKP